MKKLIYMAVAGLSLAGILSGCNQSSSSNTSLSSSTNSVASTTPVTSSAKKTLLPSQSCPSPDEARVAYGKWVDERQKVNQPVRSLDLADTILSCNLPQDQFASGKECECHLKDGSMFTIAREPDGSWTKQ